MIEVQTALLWLANLMARDIGTIAVALVVLAALVELIVKVREWTGR